MTLLVTTVAVGVESDIQNTSVGKEIGNPMNETGRVFVCVTALICTTIAAMYFNSMGVLWWYAVPLLLWME